MRAQIAGSAVVVFSLVANAGILDQQRGFPRFRAAEKRCGALVESLFAAKGLSLKNSEVFIRVFKHEKTLELWARAGGADTSVLVRSYPVCASSGGLGPKRRQGDGQVPEGVYVIEQYNPFSNFHMSMRVSYPNRADRLLCVNKNPGGDIFIHGDCVTIGCIPVTDAWIEELYVACVYAQEYGQRAIAVHIFPLRLTEQCLTALRQAYTDTTLLVFWENLREVYRAFETTRRVPAVTVDAAGAYRVGK